MITQSAPATEQAYRPARRSRREPVYHCHGCGRRATRWVWSGDRWRYMCSRCSLPSELAERTAAVRATWSDETFVARALGMDVREAQRAREIYFDDPRMVTRQLRTGRVITARLKD